MKSSSDVLRRRDFLKGMAAVGVWSLCPTVPATEPNKTVPASTIPMRPFGRTGHSVSILSLGGMFDIPNNQLLLRRALQMGVTYWDTADCYEGGRSELGIGQFFAANPDARKKVFLVTKSDARDPNGMTKLLNRSLERMKTDYIDLYFIHGVRIITELSGDVKAWASQAKKQGKIRLFGFSTHANMESNLMAAARLGWIDGIMFSYNFRLMHEDSMKRAVDDCAEAGIGLTAMKTQGGGPVKPDADVEKALASHFLAKGFTPQQAKLKAVWSNPQIASICSQMPNLRILNANIAAALDQTSLTAVDHKHLKWFANCTAATYCAGCADLCEKACGLPVSELMRCLMYEREYGLPELARREFNRLSRRSRRCFNQRLLRTAEQACPRHLPLAAIATDTIQRWTNTAS